MIDGIGIGGMATQYAIALFISLSSGIFFLYFYLKGVLSFDETPKTEMFHDDEQ